MARWSAWAAIYMTWQMLNYEDNWGWDGEISCMGHHICALTLLHYQDNWGRDKLHRPPYMYIDMLNYLDNWGQKDNRMARWAAWATVYALPLLHYQDNWGWDGEMICMGHHICALRLLHYQDNCQFFNTGFVIVSCLSFTMRWQSGRKAQANLVSWIMWSKRLPSAPNCKLHLVLSLGWKKRLYR